MQESKFDTAERPATPKLLSVEVPTDREDSIVTGRNGVFHIEKLWIWENGIEQIYIEGIGKSGKALRGGLRVTMECFAQAARDFLAAYHERLRLKAAAAAGIRAAERCERVSDEEVEDPKTVFQAWKMCCPACCSDEGIEIVCNIWARLHVGGTTTDDTFDGSHEWSAESPAKCRRCDFSGTVLDFEIDEKGTAP
jgi:hypothetical protein